ncbi:MAG: porin, partial [Gammaproteobacteria bacterium]|nr:porin [Gammaproteobacteria bacterium]
VTCSNTGANMWALGYQHAFTKHALVYADYARTTNNSNGTYSAFGGGHGNTTGAVAAGKDPHGVSVGMIYTF